jgi:Uma2 family endonuclease
MTTATPAAETKLLSAEEFLLLPKPADGARQELVRGGVITMPAPGFRHGVGVGRVYRIVDGFVFPRRLGRVTVEAGLVTERGPYTVRGPDVAYWSAARIPLDWRPHGLARGPGRPGSVGLPIRR